MVALQRELATSVMRGRVPLWSGWPRLPALTWLLQPFALSSLSSLLLHATSSVSHPTSLLPFLHKPASSSHLRRRSNVLSTPKQTLPISSSLISCPRPSTGAGVRQSTHRHPFLQKPCFLKIPKQEHGPSKTLLHPPACTLSQTSGRMASESTRSAQRCPLQPPSQQCCNCNFNQNHTESLQWPVASVHAPSSSTTTVPTHTARPRPATRPDLRTKSFVLT